MRKFAIYAVALLVLAVACKKTEKGENNRWKSGIKTVEELKVLYPGFKKPLDDLHKQAQAAMDAAKAESEEKARVKKMSAANNMLTSGFVTQLQEIDKKKKAIQSKIVAVAGGASDKADRASAQAASKNAEKVLAQVDALLKKGAPDVKSASIIVKKATGDLQAAELALGTASNIAASKKAAKNPKSTDKATGAATTKTPPPDPTKQPWKCEHCDEMNPGDKHSCHNCGAKRSVKK